MKILISAYACEPHVGSEPGVGWNWVGKLAPLGEEVHVVTRSGDRYLDAEGRKQVRPSRAHIEAALPATGLARRVTFHYFDLPAWIANRERSLWGDMLNVYLWEVLVFFFLWRRFPRRYFDLTQRVTIVSHRFPSLVGYFGKKFVLGPIAGGERFPLALLRLFSPANRLKELLRLFFQFTPWLDPLVRLTWASADEVIAVTPETRALLPAQVQRRCRVEQAVHPSPASPPSERMDRAVSGEKLRLLYVGRLVEWKGLGLVIDALARRPDLPYQLTVVGQGPDGARLEARASRRGVGADFVGFIPQQALGAYYQAADLLVFPSLRDSGGFVVLEAQAAGLPVLTLDLGGPYLNLDERGIAIATRGQSLDAVTEAIADALTSWYQQRAGKLVQDPRENHHANP